MQAWSLTSESKNPIDLYSHKCLRSTPLLNFRNEQLFRSQWISWVLLSVPELVLGSMVTAQGQAVQGRSGHQRTDYRPSHQTDPPTRHTLPPDTPSRQRDLETTTPNRWRTHLYSQASVSSAHLQTCLHWVVWAGWGSSGQPAGDWIDWSESLTILK